MNSMHHHPDRRSPYVFDVLELGRRPGATKEIRVDIPAPADLGYDAISVPQDSGVDLGLKPEATVEGVLVMGAACAQAYDECVRYLSAIKDEKPFDLQELYFCPGNRVDEDGSVVIDDAIDLEKILRDAVVLELPFVPLCDPDYLSLCQGCGFNLNDDSDHGHGTKVDPRWERLVGIDIGGENRDQNRESLVGVAPLGIMSTSRFNRSEEKIVVAPKRKISCGSAHSRRAQWKTSVVPTATCVNPACRELHLFRTACPFCGQHGAKGARRQVAEA